MIGQFGVGFYSAYLVADRVDCDDEAQRRRVVRVGVVRGRRRSRSTPYEGSATARPRHAHHLHLKEDQQEYLEERRLKDLIKKHSQFIQYPISLQGEKTSEKEVDDDEDEEEKKEDSEEPKVEDGEGRGQEEDEEGQGGAQGVGGAEQAEAGVDAQPEGVTKEEYKAFYKALSNDWED
jgi:molecular chaperone HtpG